MTIKVAVHRVCDRCQHPFDESSLKYGEDLPKFKARSIAAAVHEGPKGGGTDKVLFVFDDLCPDCDRIVEGYIKRIRMEDADEVKPKKPKKNEKTPEASAASGDKAPAKEARFEPETPVTETPEVSAPPASDPVLPSAASSPAPSAADAAPHPF